MMRLAIVGLGLIGGSLGLAARARRAASVVGVDLPGVLQTEAARCAADELVDAADPRAVASTLQGADLVVLATPVRTIAELLPGALEAGAVVTDCGSTKRAIAQRAEASVRRGRFVPGHPMAGRPTGGLAEATAELFEQRSWILCPERSDTDAVELIEVLVRRVGASPVRMSVEDHDRAVALTSHVPQLLASALAVLAARRGAETAAGPAFASATRVAGGSDAIWSDIFSTNADEIARAIRELGAELEKVAAGLSDGDLDAALNLLGQARSVRTR